MFARCGDSAYGSYHGTTAGTMAATAKGGMWGFFYPVGPHGVGLLVEELDVRGLRSVTISDDRRGWCHWGM
jgi:hypothetical protein